MMRDDKSTLPREPNITFLDVPRTPAGHFSLHYFAAIFWLLNHLHQSSQASGRDVQELFQTYPFLTSYLDEMRQRMPAALTWSEGAHWWQVQIDEWERRAVVHLPLTRISQTRAADPASWTHATHRFSADDRLPRRDFLLRMGFLLAGLVEEDSRFGTLFADLQQPLNHRRPTLELLTQILRTNETGSFSLRSASCQALIANGLLVVDNQNAPRAEWLPRVPPLLWNAVSGEAHATASGSTPFAMHSSTAFPAIDDLIVPESVRQQLHQLPPLIELGQVQIILLRSTPGSNRLEVMGALANQLGRGLVVVDADRLDREAAGDLGPFALLTNALPVIVYDFAPGESAPMPSLVGYQGPIGLFIGNEGGLTGAALQRAVTLHLPKPDMQARRRLWAQALNGQPVEDLAEIGRRFHLPAGHIGHAAAVARTQAALAGQPQITVDHVRAACRTLNRQQLDMLASYLPAESRWDQVVTSDHAGAKLRELEMRCRHRERLLAHLGPAFGASANRGVRALFNGPSGTGKTLAAKTLATEVGMDLYRVDLSAVINKYVGETEKNLHQILSHAEELDVILLLDEGDSLLGSRTDVKSANDRYANLETNFLLQRLEHFEGIVLITTNVGDNIDTAFQRRMDVVVNFVPPQEQERWHIWQLHLPANHVVDPAFLEKVAVRCVLTGGQIRNAALHATLLALDEADGSPTNGHWAAEDLGAEAAHACAIVEDRHLTAALESEYRKAGASFPLLHHNGTSVRPQGMGAFLNSLDQRSPPMVPGGKNGTVPK